jgi:hypothetical protein
MTAANLQGQQPATSEWTPTVADTYPAARDESVALASGTLLFDSKCVVHVLQAEAPACCAGF